jgi:hypothetical protein
VHSSVTTTGPLLWVLLALGIVTCGLAVALTVDALRRRTDALAHLRETRWPYVVAGLVYAVAYAVWWFGAVRQAAPWVGHIVLFGTPVLLLVGAAYLLRVVYPKPMTPQSDPSEEHQR